MIEWSETSFFTQSTRSNILGKYKLLSVLQSLSWCRFWLTYVEDGVAKGKTFVRSCMCEILRHIISLNGPIFLFILRTSKHRLWLLSLSFSLLSGLGMNGELAVCIMAYKKVQDRLVRAYLVHVKNI